ncbi:DUF1641 domain-containing protein [Archaeoglobus sp.]
MIAEYETKATEVLTKLMEKLAENGDAILRAVDKLVYLENSGVLDELVDLSGAVLAMKKLPDAFIDDDVQEAATKNLEILLTLALSVDDEMIMTVERIIEAFKKTKEFEPVGIVGALKYLRDSDVQNSLGFLLSFAKNLGQSIK